MKKILALVLAVVLCMSVFAGCTTTEPSSTPASETDVSNVVSEDEVTPPADVEPVTITSVSTFGGTDPGTEPYNEMIAAFNAMDNNITVEDSSETSSEEWKAAIAADFAGGNEPDVIFFFVGPQATALQGKVASVEEIRAVDPTYAQDILPAAIDAMKEADGVSYAVPIKGYWEGLFVNKAIFDKYDLELPTTWENLIKACEVLSANNIVPIAQGFKDEPHYLIELLLAAGGGDEYGVIPQNASEVPESWKTGLDALKTLSDAGAFGSNEATLGHGDAVTMIQKGEAAMIADGSWRCGALANVEVDAEGNFVKIAEEGETIDADKSLANFFTVVAIPAMEGGKGGDTITAGFSSGWYITKKAFDDPAKQQACIEFVKYMTTKDAVSALLLGSTPAADVPVEGLTPAQEAGLNLTKTCKFYSPINDRISKAPWDALWTNAIKILEGKSTADEVLGAAFDLM